MGKPRSHLPVLVSFLSALTKMNLILPPSRARQPPLTLSLFLRSLVIVIQPRLFFLPLSSDSPHVLQRSNMFASSQRF